MSRTDKSFQLEQENKALLTQIEELAAQQVDRDKLIDDFGAAIDTRITEWKVNFIFQCILQLFTRIMR